MSVWIAVDPAAASPRPAPTLASRSKITTSAGGDVDAICDQLNHTTSADNGDPRLHWWPHKGTKEWVQYDFDKPVWVSGVEVYWFDDTGRGECRVPKSWELLAKVDGKWEPVEQVSDYGVALNRYNRTNFEPVEAEGLRLVIQSQEKWAGGIYEWRLLEADERAIREARERAKDDQHRDRRDRREREEREKRDHDKDREPDRDRDHPPGRP